MSDTGAPLYLPKMALDGERLPQAKYNEAMEMLNAFFGGLAGGSLVAYWTLEQASGTRADSVGANNLSDNNTVTGNPGKVGNACQFTAANSEYLSIPSTPALSMGDIDFTIAGWVYLDTLGVARTVFAKASTDAIFEYGLTVQASNQMVFYVTANGTTVVTIANTSVTLAASTWYFFVAWHDSTANTINLQVNNGTIASTAHTTGIFNGGHTFRLGAIGAAALDLWNGRLDETGIWKRVLTATQRSSLYNGGTGRTYPF